MTRTLEPTDKLDAASPEPYGAAGGAVNGPEGEVLDWHAIDWRAVEDDVRRLRQRIFTASQAGDLKKVRNLQKLMLRSHANTLLSVRRVTERNAGRLTAGIDGQVVSTARDKARLVALTDGQSSSWQPMPVKRVCIPKAGGKQRPLGIPVVVDRVLQARVVNALEPEWEARFEPRSYGFRPGRGCQDAIGAIYRALKGPNPQRRWVLDADLAAAFDRIDHGHLLAALGTFPARELVALWLKAGVVDKGRFAPTGEGTPQGGVTTPPTQVAIRRRGAAGKRDGVADDDAVGADENDADDCAQDLPAGVVIGVVDPVAQPGEEAVDGFGELEVGLVVDELGVERVELGAQSALLLA